MYINFLLTEMTYLRYFMPLVLESQSRGIECRMFICKSSKYTDPYRSKSTLEELKSKYKVDVKDVGYISKNPSEITFLLEGSGIEYIQYETTKVVLVGTLDFTVIYDSYINSSDYVVFPSKFIAEYYNKINDKNLYLGCPKYDVKLDRKDILKKYSLDDNQNALIVFPKLQDLQKIDMNGIYNILHGMGYKIIVKTRGKDRIPTQFKGDHSFEDFSWFPHSSMELISVSDVVVNFDSATVKECVMLRHPFINFRVKNELNRFVGGEIPFNFLYNDDYCINFKNGFNASSFEDAVRTIVIKDCGDSFNFAIKKYMHEGNGTSKKILDELMKRRD